MFTRPGTVFSSDNLPDLPGYPECRQGGAKEVRRKQSVGFGS